LDTAIRIAGPRHGLAVGAWGLASLVGRGRALDLCLSMREVRAAEALRIGLVDRVERDPEPAAAQLAAHIASLDAGAVRRCKELVRHGWASAAALALEREGNAGWDGSLEPSAVA
jgi:enoyl-CoA hydratase/carnithine racemase